MMALLLIITVLSLTGTMVRSASNVTSCDAPLSNTRCTQGSCLQPPCMMLCGQATSYNECEQTCNSSCSSIKCTASGRCLQTCSDGNCNSLTCNSQNCFQKCGSAVCGVMKCVKRANSANTNCEQVSKIGEMICESETCQQDCPNGNCTLICSSSVKRCNQNCDGGNCRYKCEATENCQFSCTGDSCTEIKTTTTTMVNTGTSTPTSSGYRPQMTASVGLALMFAAVAIINM